VAIAESLAEVSLPKRRWVDFRVTFAIAACVLITVALYIARIETRNLSKRADQKLATETTTKANLESAITTGLPAETIKPDIILITAERLRGAQDIVVYRVHRNAPVQLEVLLPGQTVSSGYELRVMALGDGSKNVIEQVDLNAERLRNELYLKVVLRAGLLPPGVYRVTVGRRGNILDSTFKLTWAEK
jgi:hypothetical protein